MFYERRRPEESAEDLLGTKMNAISVRGVSANGISAGALTEPV